MLQKHQHVLILLIGLLYVYSVCPLLCAAFEQQFCYSEPQKILSGDAEIHTTCCQSTKASATGKTGSPAENSASCCSTHLELVLPDDRHNPSEFRELIGQSLVSTLPISATSSIAPQELFEIPLVPLTSTFFPDYSLSYRGPPSTQ